MNITTRSPDSHNFDGNNDGEGCEGNTGPGSVSDSSPAPGQTVTFSGSGFRGGSPIRVFFLSHFRQVASTTANQSGAFSVAVTIPAGTSGQHRLMGKGEISRGFRVVSATIDVGGTGTTTNEAVDDDGLPVSGGNLAVFALAALSLVEAGWGMILVSGSRGRRNAEDDGMWEANLRW